MSYYTMSNKELSQLIRKTLKESGFTSKETATGLNWVIDANTLLSAEDREFIKAFAPVVYWSDTNCYHWAFDEKLPSGRWLENMKFTEDLKTVKALIL